MDRKHNAMSDGKNIDLVQRKIDAKWGILSI